MQLDDPPEEVEIGGGDAVLASEYSIVWNAKEEFVDDVVWLALQQLSLITGRVRVDPALFRVIRQ